MNEGKLVLKIMIHICLLLMHIHITQFHKRNANLASIASSYSVLKFPGATENVAVCRQLLNGLANRGIKVREGLEFTPPVSTVEKQSLKDLCKTQLGWQLDV